MPGMAPLLKTLFCYTLQFLWYSGHASWGDGDKHYSSWPGTTAAAIDRLCTTDRRAERTGPIGAHSSRLKSSIPHSRATTEGAHQPVGKLGKEAHLNRAQRG